MKKLYFELANELLTNEEVINKWQKRLIHMVMEKLHSELLILFINILIIINKTSLTLAGFLQFNLLKN